MHSSTVSVDWRLGLVLIQPSSGTINSQPDTLLGASRCCYETLFIRCNSRTIRHSHGIDSYRSRSFLESDLPHQCSFWRWVGWQYWGSSCSRNSPRTLWVICAQQLCFNFCNFNMELLPNTTHKHELTDREDRHICFAEARWEGTQEGTNGGDGTGLFFEGRATQVLHCNAANWCFVVCLLC